MRRILLSLAFLLVATIARAEPFEIKDGDRVLFLGDTLLEREGTYGYLETRMVEQFPDRKFTVRNLAFSGDTPLGWSRASFDPAAKGFERLKEQLALVKPTVVFLGYGMAASLQEMTDRSQDWTLNRDPARYGAEPMSAARFKKELGQCMDAIAGSAGVPAGHLPAPGAAALPGKDGAERATQTAGGTPALHPGVRFVLLSPIRHEDLRATRPGLPDPTEHNKLLEQYTKAIEELAKERGARFVDLSSVVIVDPRPEPSGDHSEPDRGFLKGGNVFYDSAGFLQTDNGIHLRWQGYFRMCMQVADQLGWLQPREMDDESHAREQVRRLGLVLKDSRFIHTPLLDAIIRKNELFFHRWRPANETYLFGFRKREQGQNAAEIPKFDPLIEAAEAEIEKLKTSAPKPAKKGAFSPPETSERFTAVGPIDLTPSALSSQIPTQHRGAGASAAQMSAQHLGSGASGGQMLAQHLGSGASGGQMLAQHLGSGASGGQISPRHLGAGASDTQMLAQHLAVGASGTQMLVQHLGSGASCTPSLTPESSGDASPDQVQPADLPAPAAASLLAQANSDSTARQTPAPEPEPAKKAVQSAFAMPAFTLADGLEISLWAENPLLAKPTQCNWDAQGRLWVASSAMYPQIAPGQEAFDKILVLEDTDGDGKAEKSTVFADGLLIPTGVVPVLVQGSVQSSVSSVQNSVPGATSPPNTDRLNTEHSKPHWACYVGQSTELLYFEDTDGDGKADKKRIVLSGFGTEDTHHIIHTLRWGPDGRLYFNQSVYIHTHMETPWGVVRLNSGGVFAYDPRTERVEVFSRGLWNTWGHAWDKWGQSFLTDGAGRDGISWAFPGAIFAPFEGSRRQTQSISPGNYPKFAGLELIYSPHFPADWQGSAVTCDFRAHKVVRFKIHDLGFKNSPETAPGPASTIGAQPGTNLKSEILNLKSGYVAEQLPVLVQTSDATFRPIDVKLGPDGALYIADWSNPIINHGEVDFRDPRRDHEHGRIWRLSRKGGAAVKWESLVGKTNPQIFEEMLSPNLWEQQQARTLLGEAASTTLGIARRTEGPPSDAKALELLRLLLKSEKADEDWVETWNQVRGQLSTSGDARYRAIPARVSASVVAILKRMPEPRDPEDPVKFLNQQIDEQLKAAKTEEETAGLLADRERISQLAKLAEKEWEREVDNRFTPLLTRELTVLARDASPRVRIEAMRALARSPSVESASLILDAAINAPKDDPFYDFAAWLSINDLAEVWTKAVLAGEWKPEGREKQFEFALNAIEPRLAGQVLSQFVSTGRAPLDGSGPWIELIGNTGGPGELRPLLDGLLAATIPDGDKNPPLADAKHKFKTPDANARAAAALVAAARRGVKPAGAMPPWQLYLYAPDAALPDVLRLAGLWKQDFPSAIIGTIDGPTPAPVLDAAFEALRTLGTPKAADFLAAILDPARDGAPSVPAATKPNGEAALQNGAARGANVAGEDARRSADKRRRALVALAPLRPNEAMKHLGSVLTEIGEQGHLQLWRDLFASQPFLQRFNQAMPKDLPPVAYAAALRGAREMGRKGDGLAAKLAPLAGESTAKVAPADYNDLAARAKNDGDPVAGEALYRRTASACTTCHAIGGAGGKLGPDMTSIGASAPPDYIIESILNPAAKVKEGYHAFTFAMKDGTEAIGIPTRETPQEQFIRTLAGEQGLPRANIVTKKITEGGASLMPAGLVNAWTDRERLNLYAFLMELGRPGPFDASKNNVARVWQLADTGKVDGALKDDPNAVTLPVYTLVDGRLTKDLLAEKLAMLAPKNEAVHLTTRFQAASAGKTKLNLTGIRKAWLDGQPLAIASEPSPSVELSAGEHTFTVEVDAKSPPEVVRVESGAVSFIGE